MKNWVNIAWKGYAAILMSLPCMVMAQMVDVSNEMDLETQHIGGYLGAGVSFADFNGDYIDDLSFADFQGNLKFYAGTGTDTGFVSTNLGLPAYPQEAKMVLWGDIDNDGDQDLFVTYRLAANKLYLNNGDDGMEDVSEEAGISIASRRSYGACFGDYNNDGFLDLYVCNYTGDFDEFPFNELYENNGDGTFSEVLVEQNMNELGIQSFQGQWVDFNDDGLLDLHVSRDRLLYPNHYFEQQPAESIQPFLELGTERGLDLMINCMGSGVADCDGDLDSDIYLSGLPGDMNWLMVNNGSGIFSTEDAEGNSAMGQVQVDKVSWAPNWLDADNNGFEDLHVATGFSVYTIYPQVLSMYPNEPDGFFYNEGGSFTPAEEPPFVTDNTLSFSTAVGDYNLDGFPDLVSHCVGEYAQLLRSTPNDNNWIKIHLKGVESNRDGVGAKIIVHTNDGVSRMRYTYAGEAYLSQNSRWESIGLADAEAVLSVEVHWPNGALTTHPGLDINRHWLLCEEGTSTLMFEPDPCATGIGECAGCTYPSACNYLEDATADDGSCTFDCYDVPNACGPGTEWDPIMGWCVSDTDCPYDFDNSGYVTIADLLIFLLNISQPCPN